MDDFGVPVDQSVIRGRSWKKFLAARFIKDFRRWRKYLLLYFLILAVTFILVGWWQSHYIHSHIEMIEDNELSAWADKVNNEIRFTYNWDLKEYRNASIPVPVYYVLTSDGVLIDIEGEVVQGIFGAVKVNNSWITGRPRTIVSKIGESWRIAGRQIQNGIAIVGMPLSLKIPDADNVLLRNLNKFGSTFKEAAATKSRTIDQTVDYAVLNGNDEITLACGGLPLQLTKWPRTTGERTSILYNGNERIKIYLKPILAQNYSIVGTIVALKGTSNNADALKYLDIFNGWLLVVMLMSAIMLLSIFFWQKFFKSTKAISLDEALRGGESDVLEFKSTFCWNTKSKQKDEEIIFATLRTIAAFLNTNGGTLFIGVKEEADIPAVYGIQDDIKGNRQPEPILNQ